MIEELLAEAKDRDLGSLVNEIPDVLALEPEQLNVLPPLLDLAWVCGACDGHTDLRARIPPSLDKAGPIPWDFAGDFDALVSQSTETFNLAPHDAVRWREFLEQARLAGAQAVTQTIIARVVAPRIDLAGEALKWLSEREQPS